MNVTIFGAGNMGRGIGHRLVAGGHQVNLRDTKIDDAQKLAEELNKAGKGKATASPTDASIVDPVVVLAVTYAAARQMAREHGAKLAGKTVIALVESAGMRPLNAGALKYSRQLEGMALLNITLQSRYNFGWMSAWKLLV